VNLAIIAAGESSRIKADGISAPKPLIPINGEKIIDRNIRIAKANGFANIYCIINEQEKVLKDYLSEERGIPVKVIVKSTPSSMHSLFALAPFLYGKDPFLLAASDSIFDETEFSKFISYCTGQKAGGVLAITQYIDDEKPLCVELDGHNNIIAFSDTQDGYEWATGGLYFFSPRIFDMMPAAINNNISRLRNFLRLLLQNNYELRGFPFSKIIDVDHAKDVYAAADFLNSLKNKNL
jgi:NDP-sugar pyrophosphorylase family protein